MEKKQKRPRKKLLTMGGEAIKNQALGPATMHVLKRIEKHPPPEDIRGLPKIIEERCILCATCIRVCPTHCLEIEKAKGREGKDNGMIWILRPQCMVCGNCQTYCPTDAIIVNGGEWLSATFDLHHDYEMLVAKGTYKEKVKEKMEALRKQGDEVEKARKAFRGE